MIHDVVVSKHHVFNNHKDCCPWINLYDELGSCLHRCRFNFQLLQQWILYKKQFQISSKDSLTFYNGVWRRSQTQLFQNAVFFFWASNTVNSANRLRLKITEKQTMYSHFSRLTTLRSFANQNFRTIRISARGFVQLTNQIKA